MHQPAFTMAPASSLLRVACPTLLSECQATSGSTRARPRTRRIVSPSTVRVATALAIPELLRSLGADPVEVLGELGYDARLFDDPENRLPLAAHNRIVGHCAARTGCPHFGLLVGQADGLHSFGLVGLLVKHSPDVETAMRSFVRYLYLHVQGAAVDLRGARQRGDANLAFQSAGPRGGRSRRRWCAGGSVQRHARAVRTGLAAHGSLVRAAAAGGSRSHTGVSSGCRCASMPGNMSCTSPRRS